MHRLFVAIRPPKLIREILLDTMEGAADVRWQDEEQLHLTLRFIGEVDRHLAEYIALALGRVRQPRFELRLDRIGSFDRKIGGATLWAGVAPPEPLHALHKKIDHVVQQAGAAAERRAYAPHITMGRLTRGSRKETAFGARAGGLSSPPFPVDSFILYESRLSAKGASYDIIERYPLE